MSTILSTLISSLSRRPFIPISLSFLLTSYLIHRYRHIHTNQHPTLPSHDHAPLSARLERRLYYLLPISMQHKIRDSGLFAHISDTLAIFGGFLGLCFHPHLLSDVFTHHDRIMHISYGEHDRCVVDVYHHGQVSTRRRPVIVFIHGGAWGSGNKLMYRLYAHALAKYTQCIVVCLQYRVYPAGTIPTQCSDVMSALSWCHMHAPSWGGDTQHIYMMGHSSGAHIAVMSVIDRVMKGQSPQCAGVIGLSGVYDIISHYDYEAKRGVHEISPMKPAAGGSRDSICVSAYHEHALAEAFHTVSPTRLLPVLTPTQRGHLPPICLIHGELDTTVPISSSSLLASSLNISSPHPTLDRFIVLPHADHANVIIDMMFQKGEAWREHVSMITTFISDVRDQQQMEQERQTYVIHVPSQQLPSSL